MSLKKHTAGTPDQLPLNLVKLYGQPLLDMPDDLYIPPDALSVFLQSFEGPLDLLLYLIRKKNFNILDIPMMELTAQYLVYVDQIQTHHLELAAEYLLMASFLLEIKSRLLLPVPPTEEMDSQEDPRAELVRRLLVYEEMKKAALLLDTLPQVGRDFELTHVHTPKQTVILQPVVDTDMLVEMLKGVLRKAQLYQRHQIKQESLSVRTHMSMILKKLSCVDYMEFETLLMERVQQGDPAAVVVVHFMAILELAKESMIQIVQVDAYAPIYLKLSIIHKSEAT